MIVLSMEITAISKVKNNYNRVIILTKIWVQKIDIGEGAVEGIQRTWKPYVT